MELNEAYQILGLNESANEKSINEAYKELIKQHHPDKNKDSSYSYKINEAREILLDNFKSTNNRSIAIAVTNALTKYREADKKEKEFRNEVDFLISENTKKPKSKIENLRNLSLIVTFFLAAMAFITNSTNSFLDLSYDANEPTSSIIAEVLSKDATIKTKNYDSLYQYNIELKKKVNDYFESTVKKSQKKFYGTIKFMIIFMAGFFGLFAASIQMRLKKYETNLESFKLGIDNKSKLKNLFRLIISKNKIESKVILESELSRFIEEIFNRSDSNGSFLLSEAINLGKQLELKDIVKIIILKLQEKEFLLENDTGNYVEEISYKIAV